MKPHAARAVSQSSPRHAASRVTAAAAKQRSQLSAAGAAATTDACLLTTSITATTLAHALEELREAEAAGADVVELRLDFLERFDAAADLPALLAGTRLPAIVTYRASWEGGKYGGDEAPRLRALWHAVELGAAFVDVELKAAARFFAAAPQGWTRGAGRTRIIVSSHNYAETPALDALRALHAEAVAAGADIVKIATTATRLVDVVRLEALLSESRDIPTIALGMGEAGLVCACAAGIARYRRLTEAVRHVRAGVAPAGTQVWRLPHVRRASRGQGVRAWAADTGSAAAHIPAALTGARAAPRLPASLRARTSSPC